MPVTVKVNGVFNSLVHKGSNGISTATVPDVCKTPSPAGPVPIPYPNISQSAMLAKGSTTVKADGGMMIAIKGSEFSLSNGDNPGVAGGVKSSTFMKESTWLLYSMDVKMDGANACRFMDKKLHNHENTVNTAGELQAPVPMVPSMGMGQSDKPCPHGSGVGNPVNPLLGAKVLGDEQDLDFEWPGVLPLAWQRTYLSSNERQGWLGQGWGCPLDLDLRVQPEVVVFIDTWGGRVPYPPLDVGQSWTSPADAAVFARPDEHTYALTLPGGLRHTFRDGPHGWQLGELTDRNGEFLRITRDAQGRVSRVDNSAGRRLHFEFSPQGLLLCIREPREGGEPIQWVRYEYNLAGDLTAVFNGADQRVRGFGWRAHMLVEHVNAAGLICRYEYDREAPDGRVLLQTDSLGRRWRFDYHPGHTLVTDVRGAVQRFDFDRMGRLIGWTDALGRRTRRYLDGFGRLTVLESPAKARSTYEYDDQGRLTTLTWPDGTQQAMEWDAATGLRTAVTDEAGQRTGFGYDERGNLITYQEADGTATLFERDARGLAVKIVNAKESASLLTWTKDGQLASYTDCSGQRTAYTYDEAGRLTSMVNALGETTRYAYDAAGHLVEITQPGGHVEHYQHDLMGRLVVFRDAAGLTTRYEWAPDGQLASRVDTGGRMWRHEYDAARRLIALVNEQGRRYTYEYDQADRLVAETNFHGQTVRYELDADGHTVRQTECPDSEERIVTDMERDIRGRLKRRVLSVGGAVRQVSVYRHDELGRLVEGIDENSRVSFTYDALGRVTSETALLKTPDGGRRTIALQHEIDPLGQRAATVLPDGRKLAYLSYGSGHLHQINIDGQVITDMERDELHRERSRTQGALTSRLSWDEAGRWSTRLTDTDGELRRREAFEFDPVGRLTHHELDGVTDQGADRADRAESSFRYDELGRLREVQTQGEGVPCPKVAGAAGLRYAFDAHGRVTSKTWPNGDHIDLAWDAEHRLRRACVQRGGHTQETEYHYDVFSRRIAKTGGEGRAQDFLWDGNRLLGQSMADGTALFVYDKPDSYTPLAQLATRPGQAPDIRHYQVDHIGTPLLLSDDQGRVTWRSGGPGDGVDQPLRHPGQMHDAESGLHYNRFRYYDPDSGYYLSQDPIGLAGGEHVYLYANGDPVNLADPLGLMVTDPVAQAEYKAYKARCSQSAPPGLDLCARKRFELSRNTDCRDMRQAWDDKWLPGRHQQAINELDASVKKLTSWVAKNCP